MARSSKSRNNRKRGEYVAPMSPPAKVYLVGAAAPWRIYPHSRARPAISIR
jgi:hypothetical protein